MRVFYPIRQWLLVGALVAAPALVRAQAPLVTSVTPPPNARAAGRSEPVRVTFTQPLTPASPAALQVFSSQRGGRRTQLTPASGRATTLTFTPSAYAFQPGETVNYTITTAAASATVGLARPRVGQFTTAVSCTGTGTFQPGSLVNTGRYAEGLTLGDVDGDGDQDLLVAHFSAFSNTISVHANDGTGKYSGNQQVVVGKAPKRVILGDMDGDGDLDIVATNAGSNTISVRLNNGVGQFSGGSDVAVDYNPTRVALGDLDGDGDLDLLVAAGGGLNVRFNEGVGVFRPGQTVPTRGSTDVVLGDVDLDGDLDALATNFSSNTFSVRLNDGTGTFSGTLDVPTGSQPQALVAGDVDGDGDLDVVVTNTGTSTAQVHVNTGPGTFLLGQRVPVSVGPNNAVLADVDGDGDLDLLTGNLYGYVSVVFNQGAGTFLTDGPTYIVTDFVNTRDLAVGDVDGDGDLDLATSTEHVGDEQVGIRLNAGTIATRAGSVQVTGPPVLCAGQSGELVATSSSPPQGYRWNTGETTARLSIRQPGAYTVTATYAGCQTASADYVVSAGDCGAPPAVLPTSLLPNIITPNGDQLNDVFTLAGLAPGPWAVVLYNRWGREVYHTEAYQNDWGPAAPAGLYYYQVRHPASGASQRGWLQVVK
jgi:hypothetical protein